MTEQPIQDIRVFLSSTFSDMHETRNYLTKKIFPKIEQECRRRGASFSVLDLRWGITESESKTGKVIEICIDEINRTRPFFIGLVGERYGWIPDENEMEKNRHLKEKYPWIKDYIDRRCSITEIEMQYGVLNNDSIQDAYFFLKKTKPHRNPRNEEEKKLSGLRKTIVEKAGEGKCTADTYSSLEELGNLIHRRLMSMIEKRFPADKTLNEFDLYNRRQTGILSSLRQNYIDNQKRVEYLEEVMQDCNLVLVTGDSGSGKSALLANSFLNSNATVIRTSVDEYVNSVKKLLSLFLYNLGIADISVKKCDEEYIFEKYKTHIYEKPIIWIIDGLDKIPVNTIYEITPLLTPPANIKLLISADNGFYDSIKDIITEDNSFIIEPVPLNETEKLLFVNEKLREYGKKLTESQQMHIISSPYLSNPQMLGIFLNELVQFGIFEELDSFIAFFTGAPDAEEFINRVMETAEKEFKNGEIEKLFSVLALSSCGIDEKIYKEKHGYTQLAWSAIYGAVESLIFRHDGNLAIKNRSVGKCAEKRYLSDPVKTSSVREEVVELLLEEKKRFGKTSSLTLTDKILYLLFNSYPYADRGQRYNKIYRELILQYANAGNWKCANRMLCNMQVCMDALAGEYFALLSEGIKNGLNVCRLFPVKSIIIYLLIGKDYALDILTGLLRFIYSCSKESYGPLRAHFRRMLIPGKYKRAILACLDKINGNGTEMIGSNFEDDWIPGHYEFDIAIAGNIFQQINLITDKQRIGKIKDRADAMSKSVPENSSAKIFFMAYSAMCMVKSGDTAEAKRTFRHIMEKTKADSTSFYYLKFAIAYSEYEWETCLEIAKEVEKFGASLPLQTANAIRREALCYIMAVEENQNYGIWGEKADYDRKKAIAQYKRLSPENGLEGTLRYLAGFLHAYKLYGAAADVYEELANVSVNYADKGRYYSERADNLESVSGADYGDIAAIREKCADCYLSAGEKYYISADNAMDNAVKAYIRAAEVEKAVKLIAKRYAIANEMERKADAETMAERYNRIVISSFRLNEKITPEISGIIIGAMEKCLSLKPEAVYIANCAYILYNATRVCDIDKEQISNVLDFIVPYLETESSGRGLDEMFSLATLCGDKKTALRILDRAESLNKTINNADRVWNELLIRACSDAGTENCRTIEELKAKLLEYADAGKIAYYWQECRYFKIGEKIKSACDRENIDDLFLLWCISKIEGNPLQEKEAVSGIKEFAAAEQGTDIIERFIELNRTYSKFSNIGWIIFQAELYMDWKPGFATITGWCLTAADMAITGTDSYSELQGLHEFYCKTIEKADDPGEVLLRILAGLERPAMVIFDNSARYAIEIVKAVTAPLAQGVLTIGNEKYNKIKESVLSYLEFITDNNKCPTEILNELYGLYNSLKINPDNKVVTAMLLSKLPFVGLEGGEFDRDNAFLAALHERKMAGYEPDTDIAGSVAWVYLLRGELQKVEESIREFESAVNRNGSDKEYAPAIEFFNAMLASGKGEYENAANALCKILGLAEGEEEIPYKFTEICGDECSFDIVFSFSLVACNIYAGRYKKGLEYCERLYYYDDTVGTLPNALSLLRNNMFKDAESVIKANPEENRSYFCDAFRLLIYIQKARYYSENGEKETASEFMQMADRLAWRGMPPICIYEYDSAKSDYK